MQKLRMENSCMLINSCSNMSTVLFLPVCRLKGLTQFLSISLPSQTTELLTVDLNEVRDFSVFNTSKLSILAILVRVIHEKNKNAVEEQNYSQESGKFLPIGTIDMLKNTHIWNFPVETTFRLEPMFRPAHVLNGHLTVFFFLLKGLKIIDLLRKGVYTECKFKSWIVLKTEMLHYRNILMNSVFPF